MELTAGGKTVSVWWWTMAAAGIWMLLPLVESASSCPDPANVTIPCPMNEVGNLTCTYIKGLPNELPGSKDENAIPGKATNLDARPFFKYNSAKQCVMYINITWKIDLFTCQSLQGFILNVSFRFNGNQANVIRTYNVSVGNTNRNLLGETVLRHECIIPQPSTPYEITVHSLPLSPWNQPNSVNISSMFTTASLTSCDHTDNPNDTASWVATMWTSQSSSEITKTSSLEVCFFFAPVVFGFKEYMMSLMNITTSAYRETIHQTSIFDNGTQQNRQACVTFDRVCPATYRVQVMPVAPFGSCLCRVGPNSPNDCRDSCTATVLEPIDMTNSVCVATTTTKTTTTGPNVNYDNVVTSPPDGRETEPPSTSLEPAADKSAMFSGGKIGGIVAGLLAAVILATAVFFIHAHCRRSNSEKLPVPAPGDPPYEQMQISALPKRQRVLLVYSTDNESHRKVIRSFAAFLHACCGCDVLYDEWSQMDIAQTNPIDWLSKQMYGVKQVVVVNSLGAYEQHRGWIGQKLYAPVTNLLLPDVFVPAIRQVQSKVFSGCPQFRCFHVSFQYTDQRHVLDLSGGKCYRLMDHIEDLFLHIHGLTKFGPNGTTSADQINAASYYRTAKEGISLRKAIEEATDFARDNPNWFQAYYRCDDDDGGDVATVTTGVSDGSMPRDDVHLYDRIGAGSPPVNSTGTTAAAAPADGSDSSSIGTASDMEYFAPSPQGSCSGDDPAVVRFSVSPDAGIGGMGQTISSSGSSSIIAASPAEPKFLVFAPLPPEDLDGGDDTSSIGSRYVATKINELNDQYDSGLSSSTQNLAEMGLHRT